MSRVKKDQVRAEKNYIHDCKSVIIIYQRRIVKHKKKKQKVVRSIKKFQDILRV